MGDQQRSWWGWGWESEALEGDQLRALAGAVAARLGRGDLEIRHPPDLNDLALRAPRIDPRTP
jgi:hypothetical protein